MSKYWSEITKSITPYVPGEQPRDKKYIKINTNESPYPPSPKVIEAIKEADDENLKLYPDPTVSGLRETVAQYYNLDKDQVFVGNGSDEILAFSYMAFFNPGKPVLFADITYSFYDVYAALFKIDYRLIPLDEEFNLPLEEFFQENGGVLICNPNAPTGKYIPVEEIQRILNKNMDQVVIVDEAYIDFGGESSIKLIQNYPNLLVIQTLSKSRSLAGLRVGFALGHKDLIEGLDRIKNSFNSYTLDRLAMAGADAAMKDQAYFEETRNKIIKTRETLSQKLKEIGFKVLDSKANFIFISHPDIEAYNIFQGLREKGVLVRYFNKPRIKNYLRVSIGTDEEMEVFYKGVKEIIGAR
ncbi:MAG: histidinol-phosphate transaminase [Clostridia bacterium]|nr:histidinol-phosphate transaminase [Clostridia bacterium]